MQLSYQVVGGGGGYVKIYDSALPPGPFDPNAQTPSAWNEFKPHFTAVSQKDAVFTTPGVKATQFRQNLSNVVCTLQARLLATYDTPYNCLASQLVFAALLELTVHFQVKQDAGTPLYYPNAVVDDYEFDPKGISAWHTFTFTSDTVTIAPP